MSLIGSLCFPTIVNASVKGFYLRCAGQLRFLEQKTYLFVVTLKSVDTIAPSSSLFSSKKQQEQSSVLGILNTRQSRTPMCMFRGVKRKVMRRNTRGIRVNLLLKVLRPKLKLKGPPKCFVIFSNIFHENLSAIHAF